MSYACFIDGATVADQAQTLQVLDGPEPDYYRLAANETTEALHSLHAGALVLLQ